MDDLDLLRSFGDELVADRAVGPDPAMVRLLQQADPATRPRRSGRPAVPGPRWLVPLAAAAAVAVVLAVVVPVARRADTAQPPIPSPTQPPIPTRTPTPSSTRSPSTSPSVPAAVDRSPDRVPAPSDFVYRRWYSFGDTVKDYGGVDSDLVKTDPSADPVRQMLPSVREAWLSADGSRVGLVEGDLEHSGLAPSDSCVPTSCTDPYYRTRPTDPSGVLADLGEARSHRPEVLFVVAADFLVDRRMSRAVRTAVFQALSTLPGAQVDGNGQTVLGRPGIAVRMVTGRMLEEIVFDPVSYQAIGTRTVQRSAGWGRPAGTVVQASALLETGIVHHLMDRPDGSRRSDPPCPSGRAPSTEHPCLTPPALDVVRRDGVFG